MLSRAAEKGSMSKEDAAAATVRIKVINALAEFKPCHAIIEAVVENLDVKRQVFGELENIVAPDCILATNTSSMSVTSIAAKLKTPQRFAGFHFFNPVPLMRLVEVISGLLTEEWVCEALVGIGKRMTREPVRCTDAPGFLVNQVGRGFSLEATHLVYEGISTFADVDRVMRDVGGFRMGPFELMELTGLDVTQPASHLIYNQFFQEPRYRPSLIMQSRYEAGVLGRKTKKGFYNYDADMKAIVPPEPPGPTARPDSVWVSAAEPAGHAALSELLSKLGANPTAILKLVLGQGMILTAIGLVLGLVGAAILTRTLSGLVYGVGTLDPLTFIAVPALLSVVALVACFLPARRAASVDPITTLRQS